MPRTSRIVLAAATAGLLTGAFATAAAAAATASAAPAPYPDFTGPVQPVEIGSYLNWGPGSSVILGGPKDWVFHRAPSGAYTIRTSNLHDAPCLTSKGEGQAVHVAACRPGHNGQNWNLTPLSSDQPGSVLIESADRPGDALEAHGTDGAVTLEPETGDSVQQWNVATPTAN